MAKTRGSKEGFTRDPSMSMPSEQKTSESNKQKIAKIHDVFPDLTKDNIAKILQFYDDDESKAIDGITSDGGIEALSNWADSGSLKNRNNKNKKKKKKAKRDAVAGMTTTASFDADDSSSLHSGGNIDADIEKDNQRTENGNGILTDVDEAEHLNKLSNHERLSNAVEPVGNESERETESFKLESKHSLETSASAAPETTPLLSHNCDRNEPEHAKRVSPLSDSSEKPDEQVSKRDKYRSINDNYQKYPQRQRTGSFRRPKGSISEDQPSQHNPQAVAAPTKRGYEKCKKDLNRQTISLQRINSQIEKGFEDSEKRIKSVFADLKKAIENRHKEIEADLERTKVDALNLLKSRQDLAVELKRRVDRTASLTESEWTELRSDIKQFVTERKYDDDLGKTIWFHWTDITENFKSFGEVTAVKNVYSQRSHSALGNSAVSNNPEPSPSSSLANDEIESSADKNDVANISDAVEEAPVTEKEEVPAFNKTHSNENRTTRVYSNTRFNQGRYTTNHGRGYYRGNRGGGGGGYPNRNNYSYNRQNNNNYETYRSHPHSDRDGRVNEGAYVNDRNVNNSREYKFRNQGRGNHRNFGYNNNHRFRGNMGGHRHTEKHPEEPTAHQANVNTENPNVNGFVNN